MSTLSRAQSPLAPVPTTGASNRPLRDTPRDNPNRGKRHLASHVRTPRTTAPRGELRSSVTVLHLDPARLRTARKRNGGQLSESMLDRATVIARGVKRRDGIRAAAEAVRENQ